jgi:hypothetical protein
LSLIRKSSVCWRRISGRPFIVVWCRERARIDADRRAPAEAVTDWTITLRRRFRVSKIICVFLINDRLMSQ